MKKFLKKTIQIQQYKKIKKKKINKKNKKNYSTNSRENEANLLEISKNEISQSWGTSILRTNLIESENNTSLYNLLESGVKQKKDLYNEHYANFKLNKLNFI